MSMLTLPDNIDNSLLDALSPRELLRYSRTCKSAYSIVQEYMKHAFYVDRLLSHYFAPEEILHFRELQYRTGALISGSTAVQFFDRDKYPDSDLDVYVEHRFVRALTDWLVEIGYQYTPLSGSANMATLDAAFAVNPPELEHTSHYLEKRIIFSGQDYARSALVFNFEKRRPQRTIQLITSLMCPLRCILDFHSTCVMNIIAHDKAYSFFPLATFEQRRSLRCYKEGSDVNRDLAVQKYSLRGWSVVNATRRQRQFGTAFPLDMRYVGDRACWTVSVHPTLELPHGFVEGNSWSMAVPRRTAPVMQTRIRAAQVLRFAYTLSLEEAKAVNVRIWDQVLSSNNASGRTSDMDADFLCALKKHRADIDEGEGAETSGSSPQSECSVPLETAFTRLILGFDWRSLFGF